MDLTALNDSDLLAETRSAAHLVRTNELGLLLCLVEVDRRRVYAGLVYSSMREFGRKELKMDGASAARRSHSARALRLIPERAEHFVSGALNITNASFAITFSRREAKVEHHLSTISAPTKNSIFLNAYSTKPKPKWFIFSKRIP